MESVVAGWYPAGTRLDWHDLVDRVEAMSGVDLGSDMLSPTIAAIKQHARALRRSA